MARRTEAAEGAGSNTVVVEVEVVAFALGIGTDQSRWIGQVTGRHTHKGVAGFAVQNTGNRVAEEVPEVVEV